MSFTDRLRAAEAATAEGDLERARELMASSSEIGTSDEERFRYGLLLVLIGRSDEAAKLAPAIADPELRRRLEETLVEHADEPLADEDVDDDIDASPIEQARADEGVMARFLEFFGGRRNLYARQWYDERRGRSGYHPVHEPLTEDVVRSHLAGRLTVGQYLLWPDASVSFAVIDLDLSSCAREALRATHGDDVPTVRHDGLRTYTQRLLEAAHSLGLRLFPEDSGNRGIHLWMFFRPRRPARAARSLLAQVVTSAGSQPPDVVVEIFPKQNVPGRRGLSSLVKLPLGLHQASLRRCHLLDDELVPIEDPGAALARLEVADPSILDAVLARRLVPLPAPEGERPGPVPPLPGAGSPRTLAEALRAIEDGPPAREACERMLRGCRVLADLVARAYERRHLDAREARAIVYTLGLVGKDPAVAREVLLSGGASVKELDRVSRGLPSPMGCAKLRVLGDDACGGCPSGREAVPYATPALFAVRVTAAPPRHTAFAPWLDADETVVASPFDAIHEALQRIEARMARLEGADGDGESS